MERDDTGDDDTGDIAMLLATARFAADRHRDQRRKDPAASPYINHPLAVAELLASVGVVDVDLLCAAPLHDTVEDTATTLDDLSQVFGDAVSGLVADVTDDKSLPKRERKRLQVESAPHKPDAAKMLKLADKICNLRDLDGQSPEGWDSARKREYVDWSQRVAEGCRNVNSQLDAMFDEAVAQASQRI